MNNVSTKITLVLISIFTLTDIARGSCVEAKLIPHLLEVLDTDGSELTVQVCRALGNICYENGPYQRSIFRGNFRILKFDNTVVVFLFSSQTTQDTQ